MRAGCCSATSWRVSRPRRAALGARRLSAVAWGVQVGGVTHDSRRVRPGWLFVAVPGEHHDGHDHAPAAVAAGAVGARPGAGHAHARACPRCWSARRARRSPSPPLVRGRPEPRPGRRGHHRHRRQDDDRRTSCARCSRPRRCPRACWAPSMSSSAARAWATPGAPRRPRRPSSRRCCAAWSMRGDRFAVVESTSHGLAQERVGEVAYDVAVLTNVTHEHLEFHRHAGGLPGRQAAPVRAARDRARPTPTRATASMRSSTSTTRARSIFVDRRARRRGDRSTATARIRPATPTIRAIAVAGARRPRDRRRGRRAGRSAVPHPAGGPLQRPQRARGDRGGGGAGPRPGGDARGSRGARAGARADGDASTSASPSGSSSTTPTPPRRWPRRSTPWRRSPPPAAAG